MVSDRIFEADFRKHAFPFLFRTNDRTKSHLRHDATMIAKNVIAAETAQVMMRRQEMLDAATKKTSRCLPETVNRQGLRARPMTVVKSRACTEQTLPLDVEMIKTMNAAIEGLAVEAIHETRPHRRGAEQKSAVSTHHLMSKTKINIMLKRDRVMTDAPTGVKTLEAAKAQIQVIGVTTTDPTALITDHRDLNQGTLTRQPASRLSQPSKSLPPPHQQTRPCLLMSRCNGCATPRPCS